MEKQNNNSSEQLTGNSSSSSRSMKSKLDEENAEGSGRIDNHLHRDLVCKIRSQVAILDSVFSSSEKDRESAKHAISVLIELARDEDTMDVIVDCAAVPSLVRHLQAPPPLREGDTDPIPYEYEVERLSATMLGVLAIKPEHQQLIVNAGALPHLVALLKRHRDGQNTQAVNDVINGAADAITNIAHANIKIKNYIRVEGGIPPLVEMLGFDDPRVQKAAARALRTLAYSSDENQNEIVECNALPALILMLQSVDASVNSQAVNVFGTLVCSSPKIKQEVLAAGVLQPVIKLLSSSYTESQREAALLLGQFVAIDSDCKVHIVQRGALLPLIQMLQSPDIHSREIAVCALARLAEDTHNQAGIAHSGGIVPLLKILESKNEILQHNAVFTLYELAENEDNVADIVRLGGVQMLQDGEFILQFTRECVAKTLRRLAENIHGQVLGHLLYLMCVGDKIVQRRVALALAHLCSPDDRKTIFIDKNGLALLMELLESTESEHQRQSSIALCRLFNKANSLAPIDSAPPRPIPQVYMCEQDINNSALSDVSFLVEGRRFYAHKICLLASSDAFRAMLDGGYRERDAKDIEIPNIRWDVFELMMRYIYTGSVEVSLDIAWDLLKAADQYLLEGLKYLCECTIAQAISVESVSVMFELSEAFNVAYLRQSCIIFILENYNELSVLPWYSELIRRILPEIRDYFVRSLTQ